MKASQQIEFKKRLYLQAVAIIQQRLDATALSVQNAQAAANEEEKSSAGDKYETSRAMSHLEKDMFAKQLEENKKDMSLLRSINYGFIYEKATAGAMIHCEELAFFIATGLGKILFEGTSIFLLSPHAPLAKLLFNKSKGDSILFNNKPVIITAIY